MIYTGSISDEDEEIILEELNMSPESNILEKVSTAPSTVSHSTKVSPQTSVPSKTKIQALSQGVTTDKFETR